MRLTSDPHCGITQPMHKITLLNIILVGAFAKAQDKFTTPEAKLVGNPEQMTFVGNKAGEGYFNKDGTQMVFQSEREPGNPFYQIYLADLIKGSVRRVSPGVGKTTCAWIHPSGAKLMFSSTHEDPDIKKKVQEELEYRKNPKGHRYSWSFDDTYRIYEQDLRSGRNRPLTTGRGYHAEGSYSPKGELVAFASNRHAYEDLKAGKLSESDQKKLQEDPSYFMDIYIMKSDGTGLRRLTTSEGYDGGPFFSPDGRRLTWRRFSPDGKTAEIFTMNIDGSDQKQITHLNSMAWAPFYHPSGDYLIFTSNILGYQNFELFITDLEGKMKPVRVTFREGFDGLPVFTPDGERLTWTVRNAQGESQIVSAGWDDVRAREILQLPVRPPRTLKPEILTQDLKNWVNYFADPSLAGRLTGSIQEQQWVSVVADFFRTRGLHTQVHKFSFAKGVQFGAQNQAQLALNGKVESLKRGKDYDISVFSSSAVIEKSGLVFVGYGLNVPSTATQKGMDSYGDQDVHNKWVVLLRDVPAQLSDAERALLSTGASLQFKATVAKQKGAVGVVVVGLPGKAMVSNKEMGQSVGIPVLFVSDDVFSDFVKAAKQDGRGLSKKLSAGEVQTFAIPADLSARVEVQPEMGEAQSVIGFTPNPAKKPALLIGAHGDHLGLGQPGNSLALSQEQGQVHPGADDNASGMAAVLELADHFASKKSPQPYIFAIWSGEEFGNLGSSAFLQTENPKLKAAVNLDMLGRLKDQALKVQAAGSSPVFRPLVEKLAVQNRLGVGLNVVDDPFLPTDSMAFYLAKVPVLDFFSGSHGEYHSPRDTRDRIDFEGLTRATQAVAAFVAEMSNLPRIPFQEVESSRKKLAGRSFRVYVGTIPDYGDNPSGGVKISGVTKNSPAEKAGLKAGDILRRAGSVNLQNLQDFSFALQSMLAGSPVVFEVERAGKRLQISLTPERKEE